MVPTQKQLRRGYDEGVWTAGEVKFLCVKQLYQSVSQKCCNRQKDVYNAG